MKKRQRNMSALLFVQLKISAYICETIGKPENKLFIYT